MKPASPFGLILTPGKADRRRGSMGTMRAGLEAFSWRSRAASGYPDGSNVGGGAIAGAKGWRLSGKSLAVYCTVSARFQLGVHGTKRASSRRWINRMNRGSAPLICRGIKQGGRLPLQNRLWAAGSAGTFYKRAESNALHSVSAHRDAIDERERLRVLCEHGRELRHNWQVQSAGATEDRGETISLPGYMAHGWMVTDVPATVLAAQVDNHPFQDPFFAKSLRDIPGTNYPIGKIYGYLPMTEGSPYRCSWWYRTEFSNAPQVNRKVWLHFNGINYRANIWVNGKRIADSGHVAGAFRSYEFEISELLRTGKGNAIAVEVFAQTEKDLGIDFLDWNPAPADKSMGLWRDVYLVTSGPVTV